MEENNNQASNGGTITLSKLTVWKAATFLFLGLFVISLLTGGFGIGSGSSPGTGAAVAPTPSPSPSPGPSGSITVSVNPEDSILGDPDAPIKIVEFSDFQCPFCARAATGSVAEFKNSDYFKNGEVALVYKHFPLRSIHPDAQKAGEASECAADQGKFWEYHDLLFANQRALDGASLKQYAGQLGLNQAEFDSCLDNGDKASKVNKDLAEASAAGGRGTPYFVIVNEDGDTQAVSGAVPFANIEAAINALQ